MRVGVGGGGQRVVVKDQTFFLNETPVSAGRVQESKDGVGW